MGVLVQIWSYEHGLVSSPMLSQRAAAPPVLGGYLRSNWTWTVDFSMDGIRNYLAALSWDLVNAFPWGDETSWSAYMRKASQLSTRRFMVECPLTWVYYLGDTVCGWQEGPDGRSSPLPPPAETIYIPCYTRDAAFTRLIRAEWVTEHGEGDYRTFIEAFLRWTTVCLGDDGFVPKAPPYSRRRTRVEQYAQSAAAESSSGPFATACASSLGARAPVGGIIIGVLTENFNTSIFLSRSHGT
ncbi:uncharacterized protein [Euphorbia lathyris]